MRCLAYLSLVFVLSGCSYTFFKGNVGRPTDPPTRTNPDAKVSFDFVMENIFERHCNECHSGPFADADYDTSTFKGALKQVIPGNPEGSLLYQVLITNDPKKRMPRKAAPLSGAEVQIVYDWIKDGAIEHDEATPAPLPKPDPTPEPEPEPGPEPGPDPEPKVPSFSELLENVLRPRCAECHEGELAEAELDVTNIESVLGFVIPGNPEDSVFYESLVTENERERMPRRAPPLPKGEIQQVYQWIKAGAKGPTAGIDPSFTKLMNDVLTPRCVECHEGPFADAEFDITVPEQVLGFVNLERPEESLLYQLLVTDDESERMPRKADRLPQEEIDQVLDWIKMGAPTVRAP